MKSRDELLAQSMQANTNKQLKLYRDIHDKLENAASNGHTSITIESEFGHTITQMTKSIAQRLKQEGFYVKYFTDIDKSSGYTVNYIQVSLIPIECIHKTNSRRIYFCTAISIILGFIIGFLISML